MACEAARQAGRGRAGGLQLAHGRQQKSKQAAAVLSTRIMKTKEKNKARLHHAHGAGVGEHQLAPRAQLVAQHFDEVAGPLVGGVADHEV